VFLRTLLILRCHRADAATLAAYDRYAAVHPDVVLCCDERDAPVDMGGRDKVGFDADTLRTLGLLLHPRCGWRCGDYPYYVTRTARPDFDFYLLTEPDVLISTANLQDTIAALTANGADFLAARFDVRDERWEWARTMRHLYADTYGCIFPLTRLSARAIDHLHKARRAMLAPESAEVFENWPNDEVFVATELQNNGFACMALDAACPGLITRDSFRTGLPHDRATLEAAPPDGLIYHPVRSMAEWFDENAAWAAHHGARQRDRGEPPRRGDVMHLLGLATGSLEREAWREAAVYPLMLARGAGPTEPPAFRDQADKEGRAARMLAKHFGPNRNGRAFATAHLLSAGERRPAPVAGAADFGLGEAVPLYGLPVGFALPYATDFDTETLLFTLHPQPLAVLGAESALDEQRRLAAVGALVHWRHLPRFYPLPEGRPCARFLLEDDPSLRAEAAARLRASGVRAVAGPPALLQLAANATRYLDVRPQWQAGLLWACIAPASVVHGAVGDAVFVVPGDVLRLGAALRSLLPGVEFLRHQRDAL
jgi:hypothetical protein